MAGQRNRRSVDSCWRCSVSAGGPVDGRTEDEVPPLVCQRCGARRWNDESVRWVPLTGPGLRQPYCAEHPVYPSGELAPEYGPRTDDEFITDGLEWAVEMLIRRDQMNAAVHCGPVRWSEVTMKARIALAKWREKLS